MAKAKKKVAAKKPVKAAAKKPAAKAAPKAAKKAVKAPAKKAAPKAAKKPAPKKAATKAPAKKSVVADVKKAVSKVVKAVAPTATSKPAPKAATPKVSASVKALAKSLSPLDDRILISVEEGERVTAGGLIIPDSAQVTGNNRGLVQAVGKGHRDAKGNFRPTELKAGDRILFSQFSGTEITWGGEKFKILRETEVLGLVDAE